MKVRQKEILCWYCYYKVYKDRIKDIKCINKIDNQSARTLVYNEIKTLLPDITDVNLHSNSDGSEDEENIDDIDKNDKYDNETNSKDSTK
ncbi:13888_t:CDS:2, partial [Racocetra persica]